MADARAFRALMKHIKQIDARTQTVIMCQVENEVGLFYSPVDNCDEALKSFKSNIPQELSSYLIANKNKLEPQLDSIW